MKKVIFIFIFTIIALGAWCQKVDSIYFHLYTDSLKKGVHNYINVDGKLANGRWMPLTSREIDFTSSAGQFEGNDLVLPMDFKPEKVTVRAVLKSNTAVWREITIWIKIKPDDEKLKTSEEILGEIRRQNNRKKG